MEKAVYELIFSRFDAIRKPEAVELFLQLLKILIEDLDLGPENPKLALTVPRSQNRFVVNLNSRYAMTLERNGSIGLLIEASDFRAAQKIVRTTRMFRFSKSRKEDDYFLKYPAKQLTEKALASLLPFWIKACRHLESRMSRSPYRKFHCPEFYELALSGSIEKGGIINAQ